MFDEQALKAVLRFEVEKTSLAAAYVLALTLGLVGGHDFYVGRAGCGVMKLLLTLTVAGAIASLAWLFFDLFALPARVRDANRRLAVKLFADAREASSFV